MLATLLVSLALDTSNISQPTHLCGIDHVRKASSDVEITFAVNFNGGVLIERQDAYQTVLTRYTIENGKARAYTVPPHVIPTPITIKYEGSVLDSVIVPEGSEAAIGFKGSDGCEAKAVQKDGQVGISLDLFTEAVVNSKDVTEERTEFIPY